MKTNWTDHWKRYENSYGGFFWKLCRWIMTRGYKSLLKDIHLKDPATVELGSGSGSNSFLIAKILKIKNITLVDSNQRALQVSEKLIENFGINLRVKLINKDIFDLNLNKEFDIVHSEGLLEHFYGKKREEALKIHVKLCRKDGFVIIFVPYECIQYRVLKWTCQKLKIWFWDEKPFSRQELYQLCSRLGLKIVREYTSPLIHEIGVLIRK